MPNENCLAGIRCPSCGSEVPFKIYASSWFLFYDDGSDHHEDVEFEGDAPIACQNCKHVGTVDEFSQARSAVVTVPYSDIKVERLADARADVSYLHQDGFESLLDDYRNGDLMFIGVRASVTLKIPHGKSWILQHITSPGLWGIEYRPGKDDDSQYIQDVEQEEKVILLDMLEALNVYVTND